jgi:hypothetical protein
MRIHGRPRGRECWSLIVLVSMVVLQQTLAWQADRREGKRVARFHAMLADYARQSLSRDRELERAQLASGQLWNGALHAPLDVDEPPQSASTMPVQRRVAGTFDLVSRDGIWSVTVDLHECFPGSTLCSTGGVISLRHRGHDVCSISAALCQPRTRCDVPGFRVSWARDWQGDRLQLMRELGGAGAAPNAEQFDTLLRAAYSGRHPQEVHRESLVRGIFRAIASERTKQEMMDSSERSPVS